MGVNSALPNIDALRCQIGIAWSRSGLVANLAVGFILGDGNQFRQADGSRQADGWSWIWRLIL